MIMLLMITLLLLLLILMLSRTMIIVYGLPGPGAASLSRTRRLGPGLEVRVAHKVGQGTDCRNGPFIGPLWPDEGFS